MSLLLYFFRRPLLGLSFDCSYSFLCQPDSCENYYHVIAPKEVYEEQSKCQRICREALKYEWSQNNPKEEINDKQYCEGYHSIL